MAGRLVVKPSKAVAPSRFARVLQGRHASSGDRVRTEGMIQIQIPLRDERGRVLRDEDGRQRVERVRGTKSVDLTFSAPKSVSVLGSQADCELREAIERRRC